MSKSKSSIEADQLCSDAWARFERAVDVVAKSPPQHRTNVNANNKKPKKPTKKSKPRS
jgi:hypothetical protein